MNTAQQVASMRGPIATIEHRAQMMSVDIKHASESVRYTFADGSCAWFSKGHLLATAAPPPQ